MPSKLAKRSRIVALNSGNGTEESAALFGRAEDLGRSDKLRADGAVPTDEETAEIMVLTDKERAIVRDDVVAGETGPSVTAPTGGLYGADNGTGLVDIVDGELI